MNKTLTDPFLVSLGFRQFDKGQRFHKDGLLLVKKNDVYQLVGYETCYVRTENELATLYKVITGREYWV